MRETWKSIRLAAYVIVLPLAITAAVSAHQRMLDSQAIGTLASAIEPVAKLPALAGTFRGHTLAIDEAGTVRGRLTTLAGDELSGLGKARVILVRDGGIAHLTKTSADGSFDIFGVEPGDYSFVATNGKQFATFGARIIAADSNNEAADVIEVATVDADSPAVAMILETQLPIVALELADTNATSSSVPMGANLVRIEDGRLAGQLFSLQTVPMDEVKITIIGSDATHELQPDQDGHFVVENLVAGVYDFVAIGSAGFAVLRFEAIDANSTVLASSSSPMMFVSTEARLSPRM